MMTKDQETRIVEILQQCEDYFDARSDAWTEDGVWHQKIGRASCRERV